MTRYPGDNEDEEGLRDISAMMILADNNFSLFSLFFWFFYKLNSVHCISKTAKMNCIGDDAMSVTSLK